MDLTFEALWPFIRPFLVLAVLLAAMWEPGKRRKQPAAKPAYGTETVEADGKEAWYDAEYEQI